MTHSPWIPASKGWCRKDIVRGAHWDMVVLNIRTQSMLVFCSKNINTDTQSWNYIGVHRLLFNEKGKLASRYINTKYKQYRKINQINVLLYFLWKSFYSNRHMNTKRSALCNSSSYYSISFFSSWKKEQKQKRNFFIVTVSNWRMG